MHIYFLLLHDDRQRIPLSLLIRVSIVAKRHHDRSNSSKEKHLIGVSYSFRGLVHYHHGGIWWCSRRYGAKAATESSTSYVGKRKWPQSSLPQWHTSSNKATPTSMRPPSNTLPYEIMGASYIQTTTFHSLAPITLENIIIQNAFSAKVPIVY